MKELFKNTWKKFKNDIIILNIILFIIVIIFKNEINNSIILSIFAEIIILIVMITIVIFEVRITEYVMLETTISKKDANSFINTTDTKRHLEWIKLSAEEKIKFKNYCNKKFGKTNTYLENGEPLYFDENQNLIKMDIILELFFKNNLN